MIAPLTAEEREGWWRPCQSRKWHYFRERRSLCGGWGTFGQADYEADKPSPDNCKDCWRRRQKETAPHA